jgi:hypothetical protein
MHADKREFVEAASLASVLGWLLFFLPPSGGWLPFG